MERRRGGGRPDRARRLAVPAQPRRRAGRLIPVKLVVNVDGGARGNPGPAAIGGVVEERGERIGVATNNVAEYRALLLGIERAAELGRASSSWSATRS